MTGQENQQKDDKNLSRTNTRTAHFTLSGHAGEHLLKAASQSHSQIPMT